MIPSQPSPKGLKIALIALLVSLTLTAVCFTQDHFEEVACKARLYEFLDALNAGAFKNQNFPGDIEIEQILAWGGGYDVSGVIGHCSFRGFTSRQSPYKDIRWNTNYRSTTEPRTWLECALVGFCAASGGCSVILGLSFLVSRRRYNRFYGVR